CRRSEPRTERSGVSGQQCTAPDRDPLPGSVGVGRLLRSAPCAALMGRAWHCLVPEQELARVHDGPEDVFPGLALVGAFGDVTERRRPLRVRGRTRQGREIERVEDLLLALLLGKQLAKPVAWVAQLVVDRRAVDELERLRQVAVALALALAS